MAAQIKIEKHRATMNLEALNLFLECAKTAERIHRPSYITDHYYGDTYVLCYTCGVLGDIEWPCETVQTFRNIANLIEESKAQGNGAP